MAAQRSPATKGAKKPQNEFGYEDKQAVPKKDSLTNLLNEYVPYDRESFNRLVSPSLKQKAQALDVAKIAMTGLDSLIAFLRQRRKNCGDQIEADVAEVARIEGELAEKQAKVDLIKVHQANCKRERDTMQQALNDSIQTMQDSVRTCHKMTQHTNSNIAKLTRTNVPRSQHNYLSTGSKNKTGSSQLARTGK
ncbi:hypothetical protein GUITHDRAFT_133991 [Guillardia theta CCMP2712]|uniref:Uncharacterized protein n=1 Tax=Guillardia theta (strain CCMP2712) TaxID=905079 RepID=L1JVU2_GUITC|nr:hypothetical protein GUITHDRAFT_133991 [Guillardia theta CCMP2712]EKX52290.1 hypothetical protein GUITHDRAFT_133991 [Guillardia theta CCMP2712]|eukprot:XP_005839270.1 hypothetical protein GUITHDRAFT_133991 [Guillardia theta CCMP2712]